jgi:hypothetical protein
VCVVDERKTRGNQQAPVLSALPRAILGVFPWRFDIFFYSNYCFINHRRQQPHKTDRVAKSEYQSVMHALVYGGNGALGKALVAYFTKQQWVPFFNMKITNK